MEISTLIGIIGGAAVVLYGIGLDRLMGFYDRDSVFIVVGGVITAIFTANSMTNIKNLPKIMSMAFKKTEYDLQGMIANIIELANIARKDGLLALDNKSRDIEDEFLKKGVMLVVDGTDPDLIRNIMETEIMCMEDRHNGNAGILYNISSSAPAFGMIGTLVGLINMLANLADSSTLGPAMSVALVTTFYGSMIANWIFTPMANKLKAFTAVEVQYDALILEGLLSIQAGENPRLIEEKLNSFISNTELAAKNGAEDKGKGSEAGAEA
ncbi:MAG: motility protein A [Oscillospiraceae bacterium]|nr:motility protein A [Oscillospiraceae bacterium]